MIATYIEYVLLRKVGNNLDLFLNFLKALQFSTEILIQI